MPRFSGSSNPPKHWTKALSYLPKYTKRSICLLRNIVDSYTHENFPKRMKTHEPVQTSFLALFETSETSFFSGYTLKIDILL